MFRPMHNVTLECHILRYAECHSELKVQTKVQYLVKFEVSSSMKHRTEAKIHLNIQTQLQFQVSLTTKHLLTYEVLSKTKQCACS